MKIKTHILLSAFFLGLIFIPFGAVYAIAMPKIDFVPEVVDATTYTIKGETESYARVTVVGGEHQIPPVTADEDGRFEITVGLAQETLNQFFITASKDGQASPAAVVVIKESYEEAREYEDETKLDVISPDAPYIDKFISPVDADAIHISGKGESGAYLKILSPDGQIIKREKINEKGEFELCLDLEQDKKNFFGFLIEDESENSSIIVQVKVEEKSGAKKILNSKCIQAEKKVAVAKETEIEPKIVVADPFLDTKNHWGKSFIEILRLKGTVGGKRKGIFDPDGNITRAELTKIALGAFGYSIPDKTTGRIFTDVTEFDWYAAYVSKARSLNVIKGYANDTFAPNKSITRGEALKILLSLSGLVIPDNITNSFTDVNKTDWFYKYISYAANKDILSGYSDGTVRPNNPITRAEVTKIAVKILGLIDEQKKAEKEVDDEKKDSEGTDTGDSSDLQSYFNKSYKFRFFFNKNWYFSGVYPKEGEDVDYLVIIQLSTKNPIDEDLGEEDILASVGLYKGSIEDTDKEDGDEEEEDGKVMVYKEYDENKHFVISASGELRDDLEDIVSTFVTDADEEEEDNTNYEE